MDAETGMAVQEPPISPAQSEVQVRLADAHKFLRMLQRDQTDVREIRALGVAGRHNRTDSGYVSADFVDRARSVLKHDAFRKPRGLYTTLNPVQPELLARANNRIREWVKKGETSTLVHRLPAVAKAMGIERTEYVDKIDVLSLRGRLTDIEAIGPLVAGIQKGHYSLVILDAWYRMFPPGVSENDNAGMAGLYNLLDQYAASTDAAWLLIHHSSKGGQNEKRVTDVGSGAGSQSRAADSHIVLRPHKESKHAVMAAAVRSFPPVDPVTLRWEFPLWHLADEVDPTQLADGKEQQQATRDGEGVTAIRSVLAENGNWVSQRTVREAVGMGATRAKRLLTKMVHDRIIISRHLTQRGKEVSEYRLTSEEIPPAEDGDEGDFT